MSVEEAWLFSFVGRNEVPHARAMCRILVKDGAITQKQFRKLIGLVVGAIEGDSLTPEVCDALKQDEQMYNVFMGIYGIIASAVRNKTKPLKIERDMHACQVPQPFQNDIVKAIANKREALEEACRRKRTALPSITGLNWRIDVTISTTTLMRVFKPTIVMRLTLSDGKMRTFECTVEKFHELRYGVAKVLKNMQEVEKHPMIMIDS